MFCNYFILTEEGKYGTNNRNLSVSFRINRRYGSSKHSSWNDLSIKSKQHRLQSTQMPKWSRKFAVSGPASNVKLQELIKENDLQSSLQVAGCSELCCPYTVATNSRKFNHISPILKQLCWMPVKTIYFTIEPYLMDEWYVIKQSNLLRGGS